MHSIIRFLVVMGLVFGTVLLWRTDRKGAISPPLKTGKGQDPQEEVKRALRPLGLMPVQQSWSKQVFQSRLEDAFDRNDPCTVLSISHEEAPVSPEERWAIGMEVLLRRHRERQPLLEELFASAESPLMGKPNETSRNFETRFFNGLIYANQLEGYDENNDSPHRNPHRSVEKAVNTFRELAQEDPENGAYNFFLGQALRSAGAKKEDVEAAYTLASKAPRFDTFYQSLYDGLLRVSYDNLASFAWVYSYLQSAPVPNFATGIRNLKYWAENAEPGKWAASRFARRFNDIGAKYKAESPGYLYSQTEYVAGNGLRLALEGKWESDREGYLKRMKEVRDFISETPSALGLAETSLYMDFFNGNTEDCRWPSWQELFEVYRAKKP